MATQCGRVCAGGHGQQIYITSLYTMKWRGAQWQFERGGSPFTAVSLSVLMW